MKLEIEITDDQARRFIKTDTLVPEGETPPLPDEARVASFVQWLIGRYGYAPGIATDQHKMALAIVRAQAVEHAVRFAAQGESEWQFRQRVEGVIEAMIGGAA